MTIDINKTVSPSSTRYYTNLRLILILLCIAALIGIYLLATTVVISKDGVAYINLAKRLSTDSNSAINTMPPGYPFLILAGKRAVQAFTNTDTVYTWIYSAQAVSLVARLLTIIPLFYAGKLLVGPRNSFWANLVLIMLPYPAAFSVDILRDWPFILFFAIGLLALLHSIRKKLSWPFFAIGLAAGLGYLIRPVSAQLLLYGLVWLGFCLARPQKTMTRTRSTLAVVLLLATFFAPVLPYMTAKERPLPVKLRGLFSKQPEISPHSQQEAGKRLITAGTIPVGQGDDSVPSQVLYKTYKDFGELMMWFFLLPWLLGLIHCLRPSKFNRLHGIMLLLIITNIIFLSLRAAKFDFAMSKRYLLPMLAATVFYIPVGLKVIGLKLYSIQAFITRRPQALSPALSRNNYFQLLLIIGLCVCVPKLFRPVGIDKSGFIPTAEWLKENVTDPVLVLTPDSRIPFYAAKNYAVYDSHKTPSAGKADFIIKFSDQKLPPIYKKQHLKKLKDFPIDTREPGGNFITVYEPAIRKK